MKYDLRKIMLKAWKNFRKYKDLSFGEALHRAWLSAKAEEINQQRVEAAKAAAGITYYPLLYNKLFSDISVKIKRVSA